MDDVGFLNSSKHVNSTMFILSDRYTVTQSVIVMCVLLLIIFVSLLMNISVIVISYLGKCFEKNANSVYVFYLAVGDVMKGISFLVSSFVVFVFTYIEDGKYVPYTVCVLPRVFTHFSINISGFTLVLTSFVQYMAVVHPHVYTKWIKRTLFSQVSVLSGWALCAIESTLLHVYHGSSDDSGKTQCSNDRIFGKHVYVTYLIDAVHFSVGFLLMVVLNAKIIQAIIRRTKRISPLGTRKTFVKSVPPNVARPEPCATIQKPPGTIEKRICSVGKGSSNLSKEVKSTKEKMKSSQPAKLQTPTTTFSGSTRLTIVCVTSNSEFSPAKTTSNSQKMYTTSNLPSMFDESNVISSKSATNKLPSVSRDNTVPSTSGNITEPATSGNTKLSSKAENSALLSASGSAASPLTSAITTTLSRKKANLSFETGSTSTHLPVSRVRSPNHWKPYITLIVLVMSFIICFGPTVAYASIVILTSETMEFSLEQRFTARKIAIAVLANTIINPVIYAYRIKVYRQYIQTHILQALWNKIRTGNGNTFI